MMFMFSKTGSPTSSTTLRKDQSVSFNLELLDMEILGDDVHPLTAAFTVELFRYIINVLVLLSQLINKSFFLEYEGTKPCLSNGCQTLLSSRG